MDHIHAVLPLNILQCLVISGIFDYVIWNKNRLYGIIRKNQLPLCVKRERGVRKICVIHTLEISFILLNKKNELIISASTGYAIESMERNTVHTILSISTCKTKSLYTNVSAIWIHQSLYIIDELNIIQLELLAKINKPLCKAQGVIVCSIALFDGLPIIIFMGDFYQFAPISGCFL